MKNKITNSCKISKKENLNINYFFPNKAFCEIDSTFYMNSIIQCLVHINELDIYFLNEYLDDSLGLKKKNKNIESKGEISFAFYKIIQNLYENKDIENNINNLEIKRNDKNLKFFKENEFYLRTFKNAITSNNPTFKEFKINNCKNFIQYLLQVMHQELNYLRGNNYSKKQNVENDRDRLDLFKNYNLNYNINNFSIFSNLFYGAYEEKIKCNSCQNIIYRYKQFEFISFEISQYDKKEFNIYNGFEDNEKTQLQSDKNSLYCNICNKAYEAEYTCKIIKSPSILLINIDYGKNIKNIPSKIKFDEEIDITKYVHFPNLYPIKYRIICVCTYLNDSENNNNYISFCWNKENKNWYKFCDSSFSKCEKKDIDLGNPYLLLYEKL